MKSMTKLLTVGVLTLALFPIKSSGDLPVKGDSLVTGKLHYSFNDEFILLEANGFMLKVNNTDISYDQWLYLQGVPVGSKAFLYLNSAAIEYMWEMPLASAYTAVSEPEFKSEFYYNNEKWIYILGHLEPSFDSSLVVVQVGDLLYQIKKSELEPGLAANLDAKVPSDRVQVVAASHSIENMWRIDSTTPSRSSASVAVADRVTFTPDGIKIFGTVLHSFSEDYLIVQSKGAIYRLKKSALPKSPQWEPGLRTQIETPIAAINMVWAY